MSEPGGPSAPNAANAQVAAAPAAFVPARPMRPRRSWLSRALAAISPGEIPGPVFEKEMRVSGRRAGVYWIRGLCAMLLFAIASLVYLTIFEASYSGDAASLQQLQTVAPALVISIVWFQFIAMTLVAASSASPMVCDEKRSGTLAALLTTPLTATQILLGKVGAMLANLLVLALIPLPLLLAARIFGGTPIDFIIASASLTLSSALLGAMIGLHASACSVRASTAAVRALVTWGLIQVGPALVIWALSSNTNITIPAELVAGSSALMALFSVQWLLFGGMGPLASMAQWLWIGATLLTLITSAGFFVLAVRRLRRVMAEDGQGAAAPAKGPATRVTMPTSSPAALQSQPAATSTMVTPGTPLPPALPTVPPSLPDAPVAMRSRSREVADQPVAWRELRQPTFRTVWSKWFVLIVLPVMALILVVLGYADDAGYLFMGSLVAALFVLISGCLSTASGLTGEKESRTLDVLLATPLSAREIVIGKVLGTLRRSLVMPVVVSVLLAISGLLSMEWNPIAGLHVLLVLIAIVAPTAGSGILLSLLCKRTAVAMALNLGVWLAAWAAIPIVFSILLAISGGPGTDAAMSLIGLSNPFAMMFVAADGAGDSGGGISSWAGGRYRLFEFGNLDAIEHTLVMLAFAGFYLGLGWFFVVLASTMLAERTGRRR